MRYLPPLPLFKIICITCFTLLSIVTPLQAQEDGKTEIETDTTVATVRVLRVALKEAPPFIIRDESGGYSGVSISLWTKVAESLGVKYEYVEYPDLVSLLNAVEKNDVDLGISPVTITPQRFNAFKFSQPFYISSLGIAMHASRSKMWVSFLKNLFSVDFFRAVAVLFTILFIFGLLIWLAERKKNSEMFPPGLKGLGDGFWWSAVTMTTVGYGDKSPVTRLGRFVGLIWMFSAIILISSLTASIASALTVNTLGSNIESLKDLRRFSLATVRGSSSKSFLEANRLKYREFATPLEALDAVALKEIDAFIYDTPITKYFIHENKLNKSVEVLPFPLSTDYYGFVSSKNENILEEINPFLLQVLNTPYWRNQLEIYHSSNFNN